MCEGDTGKRTHGASVVGGREAVVNAGHQQGQACAERSRATKSVPIACTAARHTQLLGGASRNSEIW
eukprot:1137947-Pelagomonas_calceolata.AAC.8